MKYEKAEVNYTIEEMDGFPQGRLRMADTEGFSENIWTRLPPNEKHAVLVNNALMYTPYPSWGVIVPVRYGSYNPLKDIREGAVKLHPGVWQHYVNEGIMTTDGEAIAVVYDDDEEDDCK